MNELIDSARSPCRGAYGRGVMLSRSQPEDVRGEGPPPRPSAKTRSISLRAAVWRVFSGLEAIVAMLERELFAGAARVMQAARSGRANRNMSGKSPSSPCVEALKH